MILPMVAVPVKAAPVNVGTFDDLKAAIANAQDGDTITVTSNIELTETLVIDGKNITLSGNTISIIAKNALTTDEVKNTMFVIKNSTVKFDGLTLAGNSMNRIIYSENSTIELNNASINDGCPGDNSKINPGGGIFLRGGSLTATNTVFSNNKPGSAEGLGEGDGDKNGGAIYVGSVSTDITIEGGSFVGNTVPAYGHGAAIYQNAGKLNINTDTTKANETTFTENTGHKSLGDAGTQGVCIHTREEVTADINKVKATIIPGFNTGGFLRSLGGTLSIKNSNFTIDSNKGEIGIAGGVISSQNSNLTIEKSNFKAGDGSRVAEAGGLIEIVGTGTFNLIDSELEGAGAWWNAGKYTANTGGAISFYDGSTVTANITGTTIKNFMADGNGAGIALSKGNGHSSSVNLTLKNTTIQNAAVYTYGANSYGGCMYIGEGNTVKIEGGTISGQTTSNIAGGIYNMGDLEITGGTKITGNTGYQMVGGIYHGGTRLKIDEASFSNNHKGDNSTGDKHIIDKKEKSGINIYADADVIITPRATFDDNDVRVFDGQSSILLTGALTNKINVSISEEAKTTNSTNSNIKVFEESQHRKVGYVVAKGTDGYTATAEDAKKLHYVTNDTTQAIAEFGDHESTGKWDFILNPQSKQVVLGQRVKLTLHANGRLGTPAKFEGVTEGRDEGKGIFTTLKGESDQKEDLYDIYAEGEKLAELIPEPKRKGYAFTGWYKEAKVNDDTADENKSDKTKVTDQKLVEGAGEITSIINPNEYELYAGWEKVILVEKVWDDNEDEYKNRPESVKVRLYSGRQPLKNSIELNAQNNWKGEIRNIEVPKRFFGYQVKEEPKQYTGYEVGVVTGDDINGFTVTNSTEYIEIKGSKKWEHGDNPTEKQPSKVTVTLSDGEKEESKTVSANDNWTWEFKNLPKYKNKTLVTYTLTEAPVDHYTSTKSDDGYSFTNTFTNKYKVTYKFVPEDTSKTLPQGVMTQLPAEQKDKENNTKVTPSKSTFTDVTTEDGTWSFVSWDKTEATINGVDVEFVGTWKFTPKTYKVTYEFKPEDSSKTLPEGVTNQLPKEETGKANGASVSPSTSTFNSVVDGNGTWTFTSWDKTTDTINKADVTFTGTWTFTETPQTKYKAIYEFKSGTDGKALPTEIEGFKPTDETEYADGATVNAQQPTQTTYNDTDGTWTFTSWDKQTDTVKGADVKFEGTWTFAETPKTKYKATYEFKSGTEGKDLPAAIEGYKPTDNTEYEDGATVNAQQPTQTSYEAEDGTWTFTKWDENSKTIDKADVKFVGAWTFAAKPDPEPESDFTVTKTVDKQTYEKAGDVLTYTVTVKNTGEKKLENLTITDSLVTITDNTLTLEVNEEKTFEYTYTVTEADVTAKKVTNTATVTHGKDSKVDSTTSTLKEDEPQPEPQPEPKPEPKPEPDPGYWYEPSPPYLREDPKEEPVEEEPVEEEPIERPELNKDDHKIYMFGYPDWTFKPEGEMTRGEAAAMFARLFKEYPGDNYNYHEDFSDVDENYWCYKEIAYLAEWGIINGYEDGTFRPDNKISRAEFVKIVESFEALQTGTNPYSDVDETYWAYKYIVSSSAKGWINGYLDGTFKPDNNISRSEAVKIANKLVNRHPDKDFIDRNKYLLKDFTDLPTSHWAYYEIHEAANGHTFTRLANGMDERWLEVNEERFVFTPPKYHYNK